MLDRWCARAAALAAVALGACQPRPVAESDAWPEARPLAEAVSAYRPPDEPDPDAADAPAEVALPDPAGALPLHEALALALSRNPSLRAAGWEVRAAEAAALQAGLWPNPELEVEFENFGGSKSFSGTQSLETTVSLAQHFPLGGDIARRRAVAAQHARLAGWDYEAARLDVVTQTTQRYVAVLAAERAAQLAQASVDLAEEVEVSTGKRIDAGDAPPIERARAAVPVATARVELRQAQRARDAARLRLAQMWGAQAARFGELTGTLDLGAPPPNASELVALINDNPEVARWATQVSLRLAEARLAEAGAVPDLTGRLGYKHDNADDAGALVVGLALPLQVFDRRQGDELAARFGALSAEQRQRAAELRLEALLSDAYARLANAYDQATALDADALPPATEAFDVTRRAFEQGDLSLIDVLDAERTLVDLRARHLAALATYHAAAAEIEGLVGRPLAELSAGPAPKHESPTLPEGDAR